MDKVTFFLSPGPGGGSYMPGLIMPAAILLVALLSAATVIYLTRVRPGAEGAGDDSWPSGPRDQS